MEFEDITKGLEVIIHGTCNITKLSFGINSNMIGMMGRPATVEYTKGSDIVVIDGWSWSPEDITPAQKFKREEFNSTLTKTPETFNPDQLVID